ncbi:hypothetical protein WN944_001317 [Citrus x changshan-huyou]|uniref:Uncharacterized protein n=1 Tax=Citrus x changshan-huyou TaxID=2935761 RepID=A0AAP0MKQ4_9ROSI
MFKISPGDFGLVVDIWSTIVFALFCPMHFSSTRSHFMKILSFWVQIDKLSLHVEIPILLFLTSLKNCLHFK